MATVIGTGGDDTLHGGKHDDHFSGAEGDDVLDGGTGNDTLEGGNGADLLSGGANDDVLASFAPDGQLGQYPYESSVSLDIYAERDTLSGGGGDDYIAAGAGDDIDGGSGRNYLYINFEGATSGVHADFEDLYYHNSIVVDGATIKNISEVPNIQGSEYADFLRPQTDGYAFSTVNGNGGDDTIEASYYTTEVSGDGGNDSIDGTGTQYLENIHGGDGNDTLDGPLGESSALTFGDAGDDHIVATYVAHGGAGADEIQMAFSYYANEAYGDDGDDVITPYAGASAAFQFYGGAGADALTGSSGDDTLYADGESVGTTLDNGLEHDVLNGGGGDDILSIGYGDDADGGDGRDTITMVWDRAAAGVHLSTSEIVHNTFDFGGGTVQNVERIAALYMTDQADVVTVDVGRTTVYGEGGDDQVSGTTAAVKLYGGDGNDLLAGSSGRDRLEGGAGNDTLIGGAGADALNGGDGSDLFKFQSLADIGAGKATADSISDFHQGADHIDFSAIDAVSGGSDDAFTFIGEAAFDGHAGELRYHVGAGQTLVQGDVDGDGTADFVLVLHKEHALDSSDFVL